MASSSGGSERVLFGGLTGLLWVLLIAVHELLIGGMGDWFERQAERF